MPSKIKIQNFKIRTLADGGVNTALQLKLFDLGLRFDGASKREQDAPKVKTDLYALVVRDGVIHGIGGHWPFKQCVEAFQSYLCPEVNYDEAIDIISEVQKSTCLGGRAITIDIVHGEFEYKNTHYFWQQAEYGVEIDSNGSVIFMGWVWNLDGEEILSTDRCGVQLDAAGKEFIIIGNAEEWVRPLTPKQVKLWIVGE